MEFKKIEEYLNTNKEITISDLCSQLNISRQTIYNWKIKQKIPNKYVNKINNIINIQNKKEIDFIKEKKRNLLYDWCNLKAKQKNILPNLILSYDVINEIVNTDISSKEELLKIRGIGTKKYNAYGDELFSILNDGSLDINCIINVVVDYNDSNLIIEKNDKIIYKDKKLIVDKTINKFILKEYELTFINEDIDIEKIENIEMNIVRYETRVQYKNNKIEYQLFCSTRRKNVDFYVEDFISIVMLKLKYNIHQCHYSFKDIINCVKVNELDMFFKVSFEQMKKLKDYSYEKDKKTEDFLGQYIRYDDSLYFEFANILGDDFIKFIDYYRGYYNYLNIIFICYDTINICLNSLSSTEYEEFENVSLIINENVLFDLSEMKKCVISHELGHLIFSFDHTLDKKFEERRANYFSSFILDGKYDYFLNYFTKKQTIIYRSVLLKPEIDIMINKKICGDLNSLYKIYYKEVNHLYEN